MAAITESTVGVLDIIAGPMFSGKSSALLRRLFIESEIGLDVLYVNHKKDTRSSGPFSTHNPLYKKQLSEESGVVFTSSGSLVEIYDKMKKYDVIGIDESQFFDDLAEVVNRLVDQDGKYVIVAGLNGNFKREIFGQIYLLISRANSFELLSAYCKNCSSSSPKKRTLAHFSYRFTGGDETTDVGGKEKYLAVCRECYLALNKRE